MLKIIELDCSKITHEWDGAQWRDTLWIHDFPMFWVARVGRHDKEVFADVAADYFGSNKVSALADLVGFPGIEHKDIQSFHAKHLKT